jgi:hypothetical protein
VVSLHSKHEESCAYSKPTVKRKQIFPHTYTERGVDSNADVKVAEEKKFVTLPG